MACSYPQTSLTRSPGITLGDFLGALFQALERAGVRYCVLRNYEGFPESNLGNDIDFLIDPSELHGAIRALQSIDGTRIVGYTERPYVVMIFVAGVSRGRASRAIEIDFDLSLSWKGFPYLENETVLASAVPRRAGCVSFFIPSREHEAVISLMTSLLLFGKVKEKYFPQVRQTFAASRARVVSSLLPQMGLNAATRLVHAVVGGGCQDVRRLVKSLRRSLVWRSLLDNPLHSVSNLVRHYKKEFAIRYSPKTLETVRLLGAPGCSKTAILAHLMPLIAGTANIVETDEELWELPIKEKRSEACSAGDYRTPSLLGRYYTLVKAWSFLIRRWISRFSGNRNLTLRILGNSFEDIVGKPQSFPALVLVWLARLIDDLILPADLCIRLENPDGAIQAGDPGPSTRPPARMHAGYRSDVQAQKNLVISDARGSVADVAESAYSAIIDALAERTNAILRTRFRQKETAH